MPLDTSLPNIDFEPLTEVKAKLSEKVARLESAGRLVAITVNGKPKAMLVPYEQFLQMLSAEEKSYIPRKLTLKEWEKESKHRKEVVASIKNMFDLSMLKRKGQKPYKRDALKKFGKS